jgi:hypothetical protein
MRTGLVAAILCLAVAAGAGCALERQVPSQARPATVAAAGLTTTSLANASYASLLLPGGRATLVDGRTEDPGSGISVWLLGEPVARGVVDGQPAAAVLIAENGGGSGTFVSLALVRDSGGQPVNVARALLGDRPRVRHLEIAEDGSITVDLVQVGARDVSCCPTTPMTVRYALVGGELVPQQVTSATIDAAGYADTVNAFVVQATAYDNSIPPSGQGEPKHFAWTFGEDRALDTARGYVAVYPVAAYRAIWEAAGDPYVGNMLSALQRLLVEQPVQPQPPMPVLPRINSFNDFATQVAYIELPDGGRGVRFVGRFVQDAVPLLEHQLRYVFQGLTADGESLIVADLAVASGVLPDSRDSPGADMAAYLAEWSATLNRLGPDEFAPALESLDTMIRTITVEP